MIEIKSKEEFEQAINQGPVMVDFFAQWCEPCKMLSPILEEVEKEFDGQFQVVKVDVDKFGELAQAYGITNIPAICMLIDGKQSELMVGFKPKAVLKSSIEQYL